MGTGRIDYEIRAQARDVIELHLTINYASGAAPTVEAENNCVGITRTGAGAITLQLKAMAGADMAPGYPTLLNKHFSFSNSLTRDVRWGNYNQALGTLAFTNHADKAAGTAASDPADDVNTNLSITLVFKKSAIRKN